MKLKVYILFLVTVFFLSACTSDLDFNQADSYEITPSYLASLVHFKIDASGFLDSSDVEITTPIVDESDVTIFEDGVIKDNLVEATFNFEIDNPFPRSIQVNLLLLDSADNETYNFGVLTIPAATGNFTFSETINISASPSLLQTKKVRVTTQLRTSSGSPITPGNINQFQFKSGAILTFKI